METDSRITDIIERNIESYKEVSNLKYINDDAINFIVSASITDQEVLDIKTTDIELWKRYIKTIQSKAPLIIQQHNRI